MREILKQTSWLFFAQAITRVVGFFYTIYIARALGVGDFGLFSLGLAYFSIISSLADFGFNRFLIREIAKEKSKKWELLWNIFILRLFIICIFFALFAVFLYLFDQDKMRVSVILLASLAVLPQSIALTFDGIFIALQKLQFSAISTFIGSLSIAFFGFILVSWGFGIFGAINALILGQVVFALVLGLLLIKKEDLRLSEVKIPILKKALTGSAPYGILAILGLIYFRVDTIMLSYIKGNFDTGIYSAGYKFLEALVFIPNSLGLGLFPKFVSLQRNSKATWKLLFKSVKFMFGLGIVIAFSYYLILPQIIKIFLPNYESAISVIKIISLSIPFMFVHVPAAQVLLASDKYLKGIILLSVIPLTFNILLNFIFIPRYGFIAASWISVVSDFLSAILLLLFIRKVIFKNG